MKKRVNNKISFRIAMIVGIVVTLAMLLLFAVVNLNLSMELTNRVKRDMNLIAKDRSQIIETYIEGCVEMIDAYARTPEIREVLKSGRDPEAIRRARSFTEGFAEAYDHMEGLYVAEWDTYVLAHINPDSVDKTFRDAVSAAELEEQIRTKGHAFCTGIVRAPVTGKMVIPLYAPVCDESGRAIGFAGAAFYTDGLGERLRSVNDETADVEYSLINAADGTYIFDDDPDIVGSVCMDPVILDRLLGFHNGEYPDNVATFSDRMRAGSCYYMADRDWIFVVTDPGADTFDVVSRVRLSLIAIMVIVTLLMVVLCAYCVDRLTKPVVAINDEIRRLRRGDFSQPHSLDQYMSREDEFGAIAGAVADLHNALSDRNRLFREILKAQTVGTLVTDAITKDVILINDMALSMLGFSPGTEDYVTVERIFNRTDDEEGIRIHTIIDGIRRRDGEVTFVHPVHPDPETTRNLRIRARSIRLSDSDRVIIMTLTDADREDEN